MNRRAFLSGLLFAPAIIRTPGLLMPVRPLLKPTTGAFPRWTVEHYNGVMVDSVSDDEANLIARLLSESDEIMADMAWREAPPKYVIRTKLPVSMVLFTE